MTKYKNKLLTKDDILSKKDLDRIKTLQGFLQKEETEQTILKKCANLTGDPEYQGSQKNLDKDFKLTADILFMPTGNIGEHKLVFSGSFSQTPKQN